MIHHILDASGVGPSAGRCRTEHADFSEGRNARHSSGGCVESPSGARDGLRLRALRPGTRPALVLFRWRVDYGLIRGGIRHAAQNAGADSFNQNAGAEVDAMNRSARVPDACVGLAHAIAARHKPPTGRSRASGRSDSWAFRDSSQRSPGGWAHRGPAPYGACRRQRRPKRVRRDSSRRLPSM